MEQEAEDHGQREATTLDGRAEAEHRAGSPPGGPDGERSLPATSDPAHTVLPLGEASPRRSPDSVAWQRTRSPQTRPRGGPAGGDRTVALLGGRPDHREPLAEKGGLAVAPYQHHD